ncbi:MAG: amino acid permease [Rhodothermales bacterium]
MPIFSRPVLCLACPVSDTPQRLKKSLTLFDVYAISTGAMFSSGFFLLPGLATAKAGPAAVLAYALAGLLILPAMFSVAELSTAMPKAGGAYYFLDRSLGPMAGTIGGLGTWLALVLKSAFALIGMGAYLVFFLEVPIKPLAVALTVGFAALNIFGAKETSGLQRAFVITLVVILAFFVAQGLFEVFSQDVGAIHREQFTPFFPFGTEGLIATIGLVFVSYAGLTKVASVAEEVQNPDRNIPLGMALSLGTATFIYIVGVYIMIAVLDSSELRSDLTPVATAAQAFFSWLPGQIGLLLIVISAIAAFASTGNAGVLSASRYPLAMARDRLLPAGFADLSSKGTPTKAILATAGLMIVFIVGFETEDVAKLASSFQLLIFALINLAVVVMRESRIPSYVPGYTSPWYPWLQIVGIIAPFFLIAQMGSLAIALTGVMLLAGFMWYRYYVQRNAHVVREGAIYHLFARLGQYQYDGLDGELRTILKEKGLTDETRYEYLVTHSGVIDLDEPIGYDELVDRASALLAERLPLSKQELVDGFMEGSKYGITPVSHGAALPHQRIPNLQQSQLVMVRCRPGMQIDFDLDGEMDTPPVYAFFFLISPEEPPGRHLRTLANIASRIDEAPFMDEWLSARNAQDLKETLLHNDRYLSLHLATDQATAPLIGQSLRDLRWPEGVLIALIRRDGDIMVPRGSTVLEAGDVLTIIGDPAEVKVIYDRYRGHV